MNSEISYTTSLSDLPEKSGNDLGTIQYVNGLVNFIKDASAPITIALQGEWGSGKTSLMNKLHNNLCGENQPFIGVTVNTWEFSMLSSPEMTVIRIIEYIIDCIAQNNKDLKDRAKKIITGIGNFALGFGKEAAKIAVGENGAKIIEGLGLRTHFSDFNETSSFTISELRKEIRKAIDKAVQDTDENDKKSNGKKGIIIFVDDLDRLNPPLAVEILELLKNIFTLDKCIFILAIDYDVVVKGLKPKFGEMTDKNEREFRSFFDKIIQVPFSLPVSSYQPNDFIMKSLLKIKFISPSDLDDPQLINPINGIVENSVGKNPRSIKRLLNTLSLLSCIASAGENKESDFSKSRNGRIATFAIVAIQICYPKIYRMLTESPNFTSWNDSLLTKFNIKIEDKSFEESSDWRIILEKICEPDNFMSTHLSGIISLLEIIQHNIGIPKRSQSDNEDNDEFSARLKSIIDKSSVTRISDSSSVPSVDIRLLIDTLQKNVADRIKSMRPDIPQIKLRPITHKGGVFVYFPNGERFGVTFTPVVKPVKIALEILLELKVPVPKRMIGADWESIFSDSIVKKTLDGFDSYLAPLLKNTYFFESRTFREAGNIMFPTFTEEQKYRCSKGWQDGYISGMTSYWINLRSAFQFEEDKVINIIAGLLITAYDYLLATKNWK